MRKGLLCLLGAGLLIAGLPYLAPAQNQARPKKIVLLGMATDHAAGEHEYMAGLAILEECLKQTPGVEVTVFKVKEITKKNEKGKESRYGSPVGLPRARRWKMPTALSVFAGPPALTSLMTRNARPKSKRCSKRGRGSSRLHWAVETTKELGNPFMAMLGGYYEPKYSDNPINMATVQPGDPQHPISRGWKPFEARDEFYYKIRLMPEAKTVMKATVSDRQKKVFPDETIGWIYNRKDSKGVHGEGRSFGFTGCHYHLNFGIPEFRAHDRQRYFVVGVHRRAGEWSAGGTQGGGAEDSGEEEGITRIIARLWQPAVNGGPKPLRGNARERASKH